MKRIIKRKVFQVHGFFLLIACFLLVSLLLFVLVICKAERIEDYLLVLYIWLGAIGVFLLAYVGIYCDSGTDYFDETGMTRKFLKKIRFQFSWTEVRLLKYRKWGRFIPICSIGVPNGTFSEKTLKKNIDNLIFSSGVVLCMRKKKFQEIIDLIPEDLKQNMQIEV